MILLEKGNRETTQFSESFDIVRIILENNVKFSEIAGKATSRRKKQEYNSCVCRFC